MYMKNEDIIQMHDSWLVVNSIIGCTNGCKYCFLQATSDNIARPKIKVDASKAIEMLYSSKYYDSNIPICLLPNTDPFLNQVNIDYTKEMLDKLNNDKISNPIILITKCLIPESFCDYLQDLKESGMTIVIYLSLSGLGTKYEPNIKHDNIRLNFQNLALRGIQTIHYYRPFIPDNSNAKDIEKMLDFVNNYTNISVVTGLKTKPDFIDKMNIWSITSEKTEECLNSLEVWPQSSYEYFFRDYKHPQNIFQTNACALRQALKIPNPAFYGTAECMNGNICSKEQRKRCTECKKADIENLLNELKELLIKLDKYDENIEIIKEDNYIVIKNSKLTVGDVSYLTYKLCYKITLDKKNDSDNYFNSTYTNSKRLIIK